MPKRKRRAGSFQPKKKVEVVGVPSALTGQNREMKKGSMEKNYEKSQDEDYRRVENEILNENLKNAQNENFNETQKENSDNNQNKKYEVKINENFEPKTNENYELNANEKDEMKMTEKHGMKMNEKYEMHMNGNYDLKTNEKNEMKMTEKHEMNINEIYDQTMNQNCGTNSNEDMTKNKVETIEVKSVFCDFNHDNCDTIMHDNYDKTKQGNYDKAIYGICEKITLDNCDKIQHDNAGHNIHETSSKMKADSSIQPISSMISCRDCDGNFGNSESCLSAENMRCSSIHGNFHQGHPKYDIHSGKQCVTNALAAMIHASNKAVINWMPHDIDSVLNIGNDLYATLTNMNTITNMYLLISELPTAVEIGNSIYNVTVGSPQVAISELSDEMRAGNFGIISELHECLHNNLLNYDTCFITFSGNTFCVLKQDDMYWIFDSHSRDASGMMTADGHAVLVRYSCVNCIVKHCQNLAASMNQRQPIQYEITVASINHEIETTVENSIIETTTTYSPNYQQTSSEDELPYTNPKVDECDVIVTSESVQHDDLIYNPLEKVHQIVCELNGNIYLKNCRGVHYEVVSCVKQSEECICSWCGKRQNTEKTNE
ncbi:uncharacterized protein LOC141910909 isoform X3 [Tubulanus polymorphus]|uniref:uncharacterized protein LOC141910909 isoform X3 n=1 Tax=Tubulanus polymorphus TaxID=672921 RepID=UPI003DA45B26